MSLSVYACIFILQLRLVQAAGGIVLRNILLNVLIDEFHVILGIYIYKYTCYIHATKVQTEPKAEFRVTARKVNDHSCLISDSTNDKVSPPFPKKIK